MALGYFSYTVTSEHFQRGTFQDLKIIFSIENITETQSSSEKILKKSHKESKIPLGCDHLGSKKHVFQTEKIWKDEPIVKKNISLKVTQSGKEFFRQLLRKLISPTGPKSNQRSYLRLGKQFT